MIFIEINPKLETAHAESLLERAAGETLAQQAVPEADLTVVLTGEAEIHALNRDFLGVDAPTDVISFPAGDEQDPDSGHRYLGDVVIALQRAEQQAQAGGHPLEAELQLLVVHGVLHLCGHNHAGENDKVVMWAAQAEILTRLGISPAIVHE
jgi:probable rRNA maturation factor